VIKDRTRYEYSPFGGLAKVTDVLGHEYRFTYTPRTEVDSLYLPRGVKERLTYDLDGNLATHVVRNGSGGLVRNLSLRYDGRGRMVGSYGQPDTVKTYYSGLGHLTKSSRWLHGVTVTGLPRRDAVHGTFTNDAIGNVRTLATLDSVRINGVHQGSTSRSRSQTYDFATARLNGSHDVGSNDTTWYDAAGNGTFTYQRGYTPSAAVNDRASFYDADGRLRAADFRRSENPVGTAPYRATFEEYRYDALGRRVWVRARRMCENYSNSYDALECRQQLIRRTVWDGEREFWEIQMPGHDGSTYMENDTITVNLPRTPESMDPHPFYGRVVYTHGLELDQPVGITRIGYVDFKNGTPRTVFQPFTVIPGWSLLGDPDGQYIAETTVAACTPNGTAPCVYVESPMRWLAYGAPARLMDHWYGTIIENKADRTGTFYRRNRYYDPGHGALHPGRSHRACGRTESLRVCGRRSGQLRGSVWAEGLRAHPYPAPGD
jgi:hypothetical protein